jgi:hypothetical protein
MWLHNVVGDRLLLAILGLLRLYFTYVHVVTVIAMTVLPRDFGPYGTRFMTTRVYYFTLLRCY